MFLSRNMNRNIRPLSIPIQSDGVGSHHSQRIPTLISTVHLFIESCIDSLIHLFSECLKFPGSGFDAGSSA